VSIDPVLAKARHHRTLSGLSDANVYLLTEDGSTWFVRKAAKAPDGNARLRRQAAKQGSFESPPESAVHSPLILGEGEIDERFYFDMEYVTGTDAASFLRQASIPAVQGFARDLCEYLGHSAGQQANRTIDPYAILCHRIREVQDRTGAMDEALLTRVLRELDAVEAVGELAETRCHGDLTLENMVVDRQGAIWLLDFLDSPIEHYWQDVAKLHQDLAGGWYRRRVAPISRAVLGFVSGAVLDATIGRDPEYEAIHNVLIACTFARILPYAQEESDRRMILDRVEFFTSRMHTSEETS
jgi:hypothetical protein